MDIHIYLHKGRPARDAGNELARERELLQLAQQAYIKATSVGNGVMARHYAGQVEKHKANIERMKKTGDALNEAQVLREVGVAKREGWTEATLRSYLIKMGIDSRHRLFTLGLQEFRKGAKDARDEKNAANSGFLALVKREMNEKIYKHVKDLENAQGRAAAIAYLLTLVNAEAKERTRARYAQFAQ